MILSTVIIIAIVFAGALIATAALSPLETLSWWAGWSEDDFTPDEDLPAPTVSAPSSSTPNKHYIVYLSGVASLTGRNLLPRENAFLRRLRAANANADVIHDVFPYSPSGTPLLASPRAFDMIWSGIQKLNMQGRFSILGVLINLRNIFQVMVSADHRYGPIFNQGAASVIRDALEKAVYVSGAPITIIGYSGGGQIGVGAAPFLKTWSGAHLRVISVGGVIASDPGLAFLDRLHMIIGTKDNVRRIGGIVFPDRWSIMGHSEWNTSLRAGRILYHRLDGVTHAGVKGYFGRVDINGKSNGERTLERILDIMAFDPPNH